MISIPQMSFSTVGHLVRDLKKLTYQVVSDGKKKTVKTAVLYHLLREKI